MPQWFAIATAIFLCPMFIASGLAKLRSGDVVDAADAYRVLPYGVVRSIFPALPWMEIGAGVLLLGWFAQIGLAIAATLLCVFSLGIAINLVRGRSIECGCRGSGRRISPALLVENLLLATASLAAITAPTSEPLVATLASSAPGSNAADSWAAVIIAASAYFAYRLLIVSRAATRALSKGGF